MPISPVARVAHAPSKPHLIFDGDCGFCRRWIERWRASTGDAVEYLPLQSDDLAARYPELRREDLEEAAHLVEPDGTVYRAAAAVFRTLARARRWPWWVYAHIPGAGPLCEIGYRLVARHRFFSRGSLACSGERSRGLPPTFSCAGCSPAASG